MSRFYRNFNLAVIYAMISLRDLRCEERGRRMAVSLEGALFPKEVVRTCARSCAAYLLNYCHVADLGQERGVNVDHAMVNRWVVKHSPQPEEAFHRRKRPVWLSWRMDETSIKVKFLLTQERGEPMAEQFLTRAIRRDGVPENITIDRSEANATVIRSDNAEHGTWIAIRQMKYLNHMVEQDHQVMKRVTRPIFGFKSFVSAQATLVGIELMPMLRKGDMEGSALEGRTPAGQCYARAVSSPPPGREHSPQSVYTQQFATQPLLANRSMEL
jgi:putative transposase